MLYDDLRDPVALLRGERGATALSAFWPYASMAAPATLADEQLRPYTALMAQSQELIADDVLDVTGTSEELGKTPGKDAASGKSTYPGLFGIEGSRERARAAIREALGEIESLGARVERLRQMACFVIDRRK